MFGTHRTTRLAWIDILITATQNGLMAYTNKTRGALKKPLPMCWFA